MDRAEVLERAENDREALSLIEEAISLYDAKRNVVSAEHARARRNDLLRARALKYSTSREAERRASARAEDPSIKRVGSEGTA